MRSAAWLITAACLAQGLGYASALNEHAGEALWSAHAQFHLVEGTLWLLALNTAMIALAWGPLQRREGWSLWLLTLLYAVAHGAHWLAKLATPEDRRVDPAWYGYALVAMALVGAVGLALAWRARAPAAVA